MTKAIHEVPKDYDPSIEAGIQFYKQGHSRNTIAMLVHKALVEGVAFREKLQISLHFAVWYFVDNYRSRANTDDNEKFHNSTDRWPSP